MQYVYYTIKTINQTIFRHSVVLWRFIFGTQKVFCALLMQSITVKKMNIFSCFFVNIKKILTDFFEVRNAICFFKQINNLKQTLPHFFSSIIFYT